MVVFMTQFSRHGVLCGAELWNVHVIVLVKGVLSFNFCEFLNPAAMPTVHDWINNPLGIVNEMFGKKQQSKCVFLTYTV